jgi:hypothetical protein
MKTAAFALLLAAAPAAAVPTTMTYAGVLKDNGALVSGTVDAHFGLFTQSSGGTEIYGEDDSGLIVLAGDLVAELGSNALDDAILEEPELWLEVTIDGEVMTPRVRLNSVPYALRAEAALRAEEALTLGGLTSLDVVTQTQLQTAINNATSSLTASLTLSAGAGLTKSGNTLAIADGAITTAMIGNQQITSQKLAPGSVGGSAIIDGQVSFNDLAADSVNSSKIVDGSILAADISQDTITAAQLAPGSVTSSELAGLSVTQAAIAGTERPIFLGLPACGGALFPSSSCKSIVCNVLTSGGVTTEQFFNCNGSCGATASQTCTGLTEFGKILSPTIP